MKISKNNSVSVQVDILPKEPVDVTAKGSEFYSALQSGLAIVCGPCVSSINLSFIKPSSFSPKDEEGTSLLQSKDAVAKSEIVEEQACDQLSEQASAQQTGKDIRLSISESEAKEVKDNG